MNVRELPGLQSIMGFDGEYAVFKAMDTEGHYQGVINRKGEIVLDKIRRWPLYSIRDHPSVFRVRKVGEDDLCYFDVAQQKYIDKPQLRERVKSKAEQMAENIPYMDAIDPFDHRLCSFKPLIALTDDYLAFADDIYKWGIRDLDGNILIPAQFENILYAGNDSHFIVQKDAVVGVINISGQWIIPLEKFEWLWFRGNFFVARQNGKSGIVDLAGHILIPFEYEALHPAYNEGLNLISAKKDGELFFINSKQERIELF